MFWVLVVFVVGGWVSENLGFVFLTATGLDL